ncbi:MAG TPA: protein kinase, partial [Chroococcales cyanobacterium]
IHSFEAASHGDRAALELLAQKLRGVSCDSLAGVYALGFESDDAPYMVSKLPLGRDLTGVLALKQVLSVWETLELGVFICEALEALNRCDLFHGCISSGAVFMDKHSHQPLMLADFGLRQFSQLLKGGKAVGVGSPLYMSPEQCADAAIDPRSDIYSLGAIMYECLTASPPHAGGEALEVVLRRKTLPVPTLKKATGLDYPPALENLMTRCLARNPAERFASAAELKHELRKLIQEAATCPEVDPTKLPKSYNILRSASPSDLHELQIVDFDTLRAEQSRLRGRKRVLSAYYGVLVLATLALYVATMSCLTSVQDRAAHGIKGTPVEIAKSDDPNEKGFVLNPPKVAKGELVGETKLDSVMKFCSPYNLVADYCEGDFGEISQLTKLESLSLSDTRVSDADLLVLQSLPLRLIDLSRCPLVTERGLQVLQKMPQLRVCTLNGRKHNLEELNSLNPGLWELGLSDTELTDDQLAPLLKLRNLFRLSLDGNKLTRGAPKYLKQMHSLRYLSIERNPELGKAAQIELLRAMPRTTICFEPQGKGVLDSYDHAKIGKCVSHSSGLALKAPSSYGDFSEIAKMKDLAALHISKSSLKNADMVYLQNLPLRYLDMGQTKITGEGLRYIKEIPTLFVVKASSSMLRDADLAELNPNIIDLDIFGCEITDGGVRNLLHLKNLRSLSIGNNLITPKSFDLIRSMKSLQVIDLHRAQNVTIEQAKELEDSMPGVFVKSNRTKY